MAIAINPSESFEFTLRADRSLPEEKRTVFMLRPLSYVERRKIEDMASVVEAETGLVRGTVGSINDATLRLGLKGWRNFRDAKGVEVPFELEGKRLGILGSLVDPPTLRTLERLHPRDAEELVNAITEVQRVTVDEGKG